MGVVKVTEIVGYFDEEGRVMCPQSFEVGDWEKDLSEDQIITQADVDNDEETRYFCDEHNCLLGQCPD